MKHRSNEIALVAGGILLGAMLAAPVAGAALTAQESMQRIYVDGKLAQMEAYSINGHNYGKLRDIGQAVGFAVDHDPATNTVQIMTGKNMAAQAKEAHRLSFGGGYTASAYAALREAMRSGSATVAASAGERAALMNAVAAIGSYPAYDVSDDGDTVTVYAKYPSAYAEAAKICRRFIGGLAGQSDGDKATAMANYVCDRLAYDANSTATPRTLFTSDGVKKGNCMSYAHGFQFLCNLADIPCVLVHSDIHQRNEVYIGGRWYSVDLTCYDIRYTEHGFDRLLADASELQSSIYAQSDPALTRFIKELLVPGSTVG